MELNYCRCRLGAGAGCLIFTSTHVVKYMPIVGLNLRATSYSFYASEQRSAFFVLKKCDVFYIFPTKKSSSTMTSTTPFLYQITPRRGRL